VSRIIVNDFGCKNKCLSFIAKLYICYRRKKVYKNSVYKILNGILIIYFIARSRFITVTIIITALLRHSAYVIVDGKVIKMERLNESQLRVQAARLFEENYNYSVIGKETKSQ